jgi:hypothetical protein
MWAMLVLEANANLDLLYMRKPSVPPFAWHAWRRLLSVPFLWRRRLPGRARRQPRGRRGRWVKQSRRDASGVPAEWQARRRARAGLVVQPVQAHRYPAYVNGHVAARRQHIMLVSSLCLYAWPVPLRRRRRLWSGRAVILTPLAAPWNTNAILDNDSAWGTSGQASYRRST